MREFIDMTGKRFGRFEVLEYAGKRPQGKTQHTLWLCRCDCGREVVVFGHNLRSGRSKSCGCYKVDVKRAEFNARWTKWKEANRHDNDKTAAPSAGADGEEDC